MLSSKAVSHVKACRFCWMCRHLCPVQLQTGKESNTPRAKAILLDMVEHGEKFDAGIAEVMFECLLCDACSNDCVTGFEPPLFIREGRMKAALEDLLPEKVEKVLENIEESGNIYGKELKNYSKCNGEELLVYLGEVARERAPKMIASFLALLDAAGVKYQILKEEKPSGVMMTDLVGYMDEAAEQMEECARSIAFSGAKKMVVLDSYDLAAFRELYPSYGVNLKVEMQSALSLILDLAKEGKVSLKPNAGEKILTYHDDSRAARTLGEIQEPRELLQMAGYELVEMFQHGKLAKSPGTSLTKAYMPEITEKTAAGRWDDVRRTRRAEVLVTANPQAFDVLSDVKPADLELVDLYSLLLEGL